MPVIDDDWIDVPNFGPTTMNLVDLAASAEYSLSGDPKKEHEILEEWPNYLSEDGLRKRISQEGLKIIKEKTFSRRLFLFFPKGNDAKDRLIERVTKMAKGWIPSKKVYYMEIDSKKGMGLTPIGGYISKHIFLYPARNYYKARFYFCRKGE